MSTLLLETLKKAELDQFFCEWHHSLSLQEYSSLGITSVADRKKLFHLVQSLRQETPSLDNGLVSPLLKTSNLIHPYKHRSPPNSDITRRGSSTQISSQPPPITPTRTRSRTLTSFDAKPDFLYDRERFHFPLADKEEEAETEEEEEEERCEIRKEANPLLDSYGVPIKSRFQQKPSLTTANSSQPSDLNQKIRVCVRKRPLNKKELERGEKDIAPTCGIRSINIQEPNDEKNDKIYQRTAQPLVKYVFDGGKATCFAYGQTGSGKTYTMLDPQYGLYVLAARDVFHWIHQPEYEHLSAWIGFYEIYQGQLYDLLNERKKLFAREDGKQNVVIVGLKEFVIKNVQDLMQVFEYGSQARSTGSTGANSDSSRSHAVLQILLRPTKNRKKIVGKLSFIDLAGSERGADRGDADVKTRMEGAEINKSLLALKECIRALDQDKRHTPFRQSKLTQVLKDSFVGNSRTCMIATISPNQSNSEHTLNTLRYADRVKELKGERDTRKTTASSPPAPAACFEGFQEVEPEEDLLVSDEFDQDDLLLHHFPSDSDLHILDQELPHEHMKRQPVDLLSSSPASFLPPPVPSTVEDCFLFDPNTIQSILRFHRAQIREVTEYSKAETKLLANFSLGLSSRREEKSSLRDELKTSSEFIEYLDNLDEVLEMKTAAIEALRDRIRQVLGEEEL
ncbi:hypothetical protein RO3G_03734 [Rhizopus delemar RA 99-880]|uniref:Kinesin-like protein n=1 Tax=Rhizopus delemar (strain RA 99-880 / ATCC MYA-4621 / FGSC 9543 / NRRL 43880) TaxID=246409 RepID=I1BS49_RHIO9|nr:hypothetical protein RO3G_03734 [Rhizopus delemar RA 99-880]|eukprot:EIE79029.1 hypothetical protein RO3G_03734 [Rhizopus delemar RA 99-880]